jgi:hypothetical protein
VTSEENGRGPEGGAQLAPGTDERRAAVEEVRVHETIPAPAPAPAATPTPTPAPTPIPTPVTTPIRAVPDTPAEPMISKPEEAELSAAELLQELPEVIPWIISRTGASQSEVGQTEFVEKSRGFKEGLQTIARELLELWVPINKATEKVEGNSEAGANEEGMLEQMTQGGKIEAIFPIYGAVKAGKSTFLSSVMRDELLPAQTL